MKKVKISIPFKISYGKIKYFEEYDEGCDLCKDEDVIGERCIYLENEEKEIYLQICLKCAKKLRLKEVKK